VVAETTWILWASLIFAADQPGTVTITKPAAPPVVGVRHYVVRVQIIEVDEKGREKVIAQPVLQTAGAAAGVTLEGETGRRFEFSFSAAEAGAPAPLPVTVVEETAMPKPISAVLTPRPEPVLQHKVSVKAVQQPRKDVLRNVARQAGLTLAMEPEIAQAAAAKLATPINFDIDNAPLDEALKRLVDPLELGYAVRHDLLLIGFQTPATLRAATPVAAPTLPPPQPPEPSKAAADDWLIQVYDVSDLVQKSATGQPDFAPLVKQLQQQIAPKSWSSQGGQGNIRGFDSTLSLVIRQNSAGHTAITDYLERLRKTAEKQP